MKSRSKYGIALLALLALLLNSAPSMAAEEEDWRKYQFEAHIAHQNGHDEAAESHLRKALEGAQKEDRRDPFFRQMLKDSSAIIQTYCTSDKLERAERLASDTLSRVQELIDPPSPEETACWMDLALVLGMKGDKKGQEQILSRIQSEIERTAESGKTEIADAMARVLQDKSREVKGMVKSQFDSVQKQLDGLESLLNKQ
ncbi:MAG: hypothetical protein KC777_14990 [Cyanobacteria bacterium HKST-UBA02]|nr:hypothetical protein [Cyanobacteria bacterium HKST-UBA02]